MNMVLILASSWHTNKESMVFDELIQWLKWKLKKIVIKRRWYF